jgi:hypothetical protein
MNTVTIYILLLFSTLVREILRLISVIIQYEISTCVNITKKKKQADYIATTIKVFHILHLLKCIIYTSRKICLYFK